MLHPDVTTANGKQQYSTGTRFTFLDGSKHLELARLYY